MLQTHVASVSVYTVSRVSVGARLGGGELTRDHSRAKLSKGTSRALRDPKSLGFHLSLAP